MQEHLIESREISSDPDLDPVNARRRKIIRRVGTSLIAGVLVFTIGTPIVFVGAVLWRFNMLTPHPSDTELITLLTNHEGEFERLLAMFEEDSRLRIVSPTWIARIDRFQKSAGMSIERYLTGWGWPAG